jgi:hypothetical protein
MRDLVLIAVLADIPNHEAIIDTGRWDGVCNKNQTGTVLWRSEAFLPTRVSAWDLADPENEFREVSAVPHGATRNYPETYEHQDFCEEAARSDE